MLAKLVVVATVVLVLAAPSAHAGVMLFDRTDQPHTWTAPQDITTAYFELTGGGADRGGALVRATLAVTPGEQFQINVGGSPTPFAPGANGGGAGSGCGLDCFGSSGGGGASDVRRGGATLLHRVLVAGGGGGGGAFGGGGLGGVSGGAGQPGAPSVRGAPGGSPGQPGTLTGGGAGGSPGGSGAGGNPGTLGKGGDMVWPDGDAGGSGGGGGGGYYGGGAGGEGSYDGTFLESGGGGGGGGGSSYATPGATDVSIVDGWHLTNGYVKVTWVEPSYHATAALTASGTATPSGWFNRATSGSGGLGLTFVATQPRGSIQNIKCYDGPTIIVDLAAARADFRVGSGSHVIICNARTSTGALVSGNGEFKVDQTPPALSPVVSPDPVRRGRVAHALPQASDYQSGLASASCQKPATSALGAHSVKCSAADVAGNVATASARYTVTSPSGRVTVTLPRSRTCGKPLQIRITGPLKRITAKIAGKRIRLDRRHRLMRPPRRAFRLIVRATGADGRTVRAARSYSRCP